jgi:Na+/H+ antiporter NhaD/arsenite permease-like protein
MSDVTIATIIFLVTYAVIISERLNRTVVALAGSALMIAFGVLNQEDALQAIDANTIALLVSMMIMVNVLRQTGIFRFAAWGTAVALRGDPWRMMVGFALFTAVASALLDNVTTILLIAPVTIALCDDLGLDPRPFLITQVIASNIGGTATLIGDPPNILIAGATDLSFVAFIVNLAPVALVTFAVVTAGLYLAFRRRLQVAPEARARVMELDARRSIEDIDELKRTVPVLIATILLFFAHQALNIEPATVAMTGATVMLFLSRQKLEDSLAGIEWPTLFFFIGLFVMVGALEETGAIDEVAQGVGSVTDGNRSAELLGIAWVSAFGSALVDNIPFTAAMIPVVEQLQSGNSGDDAYWWALALGACFGGNATIIAAAANVAAAGMAARAGRPIGFLYFARIGIPVTLASMIIATAYIGVRYLL